MHFTSTKIAIFESKRYENIEQQEESVNRFLEDKELVDIKPVVTGRDREHIDLIVIYKE